MCRQVCVCYGNNNRAPSRQLLLALLPFIQTPSLCRLTAAGLYLVESHTNITFLLYTLHSPFLTSTLFTWTQAPQIELHFKLCVNSNTDAISSVLVKHLFYTCWADGYKSQQARLTPPPVCMNTSTLFWEWPRRQVARVVALWTVRVRSICSTHTHSVCSTNKPIGSRAIARDRSTVSWWYYLLWQQFTFWTFPLVLFRARLNWL